MVGLAAREAARREGPLWAVTSYFNPAGFRTRLENYQTFRAHLEVPLLTVEASFDGRFVLAAEDAEILIQRAASSVLWQKERLLNIAIAHLPDACETVCWLDSDLIFAARDWPARTRRALEDHALVQLYSQRVNLRRGCLPCRVGPGDVESTVGAVAEKVASGRASPDDLQDANAPVSGASTAGLAWAARRELLDRNGLYDACILGTGDRAILCAALGNPAYGSRAVRMTNAHARHYQRWATSFFASAGGRIGCVDGQIFHLWHGDLRERRYSERQTLLARHAFDPATDIAIDGEGCWRWSTAKPALHSEVRDYFASRREDGDG